MGLNLVTLNCILTIAPMQDGHSSPYECLDHVKTGPNVKTTPTDHESEEPQTSMQELNDSLNDSLCYEDMSQTQLPLEAAKSTDAGGISTSNPPSAKEIQYMPLTTEGSPAIPEMPKNLPASPISSSRSEEMNSSPSLLLQHASTPQVLDAPKKKPSFGKKKKLVVTPSVDKSMVKDAALPKCSPVVDESSAEIHECEISTNKVQENKEITSKAKPNFLAKLGTKTEVAVDESSAIISEGVQDKVKPVRKVLSPEEKEAKKLEREQKKLERENKKKENEQKKIEREQMKIEREAKKEQKRLEAEQRKADKEQKKIERELKRVEQQQKKIVKQNKNLLEIVKDECLAVEMPSAVQTPEVPEKKVLLKSEISAVQSPEVVDRQSLENSSAIRNEAALVMGDSGYDKLKTGFEQNQNKCADDVVTSDTESELDVVKFDTEKEGIYCNQPLGNVEIDINGRNITVPKRVLQLANEDNNLAITAPEKKAVKMFQPPKRSKPTKQKGGIDSRQIPGSSTKSPKKRRRRPAFAESDSDSDFQYKVKRSKPDQFIGPVWVQCENIGCQKWRKLRDCVDPSKVPEDWKCSMNTDAEHNKCSATEEEWNDLEESQEFVESVFVPGSIVWAKMYGYPW